MPEAYGRTHNGRFVPFVYVDPYLCVIDNSCIVGAYRLEFPWETFVVRLCLFLSECFCNYGAGIFGCPAMFMVNSASLDLWTDVRVFHGLLLG